MPELGWQASINGAHFVCPCLLSGRAPQLGTAPAEPAHVPCLCSAAGPAARRRATEEWQQWRRGRQPQLSHLPWLPAPHVCRFSRSCAELRSPPAEEEHKRRPQQKRWGGPAACPSPDSVHVTQRWPQRCTAPHEQLGSRVRPVALMLPTACLCSCGRRRLACTRRCDGHEPCCCLQSLRHSTSSGLPPGTNTACSGSGSCA